jgi:SAM-dependent methyltransferase
VSLLDPLLTHAFHAVCRQQVTSDAGSDLETTFNSGFADTERFFERLPAIDFRGLSVLDFGCGLGSTCIWLAEKGAERVVGVDVQPVDFAEARLAERSAEVGGRVAFHRIEPDSDLGFVGQFDVVISKNTFEHATDPGGYVDAMKARLAPGGTLLIGFAPLWKSPTGGHIGFMTPLPWAHLLFPERVVLAERRRFRPEEAASRYEDVLGGLSRMTLARFQAVMAGSGLRQVYFDTNNPRGARSPLRRRALSVLRVMSRPRALREYLTFSAYGAWRDRACSSSTSSGHASSGPSPGRAQPPGIGTSLVQR